MNDKINNTAPNGPYMADGRPVVMPNDYEANSDTQIPSGPLLPPTDHTEYLQDAIDAMTATIAFNRIYGRRTTMNGLMFVIRHICPYLTEGQRVLLHIDAFKQAQEEGTIDSSRLDDIRLPSNLWTEPVTGRVVDMDKYGPVGEAVLSELEEDAMGEGGPQKEAVRKPYSITDSHLPYDDLPEAKKHQLRMAQDKADAWIWFLNMYRPGLWWPAKHLVPELAALPDCRYTEDELMSTVKGMHKLKDGRSEMIIIDKDVRPDGGRGRPAMYAGMVGRPEPYYGKGGMFQVPVPVDKATQKPVVDATRPTVPPPPAKPESKAPPVPQPMLSPKMQASAQDPHTTNSHVTNSHVTKVHPSIPSGGLNIDADDKDISPNP